MESIKTHTLKVLKEHTAFIILLVLFAIYYIIRVCNFLPWYDELFTYRYFISQGPIVSAAFWPLPNNHIFFSVLSSFLNIFNPYVALYGISYISALGTLIFLYLLVKKFSSKNFAILAIIIYGFMRHSNFLSVQGRGYSLATFFLMLSLYCLYNIIFLEKEHKRYYILFALGLWLGLWTLPSSIYWVLAICFCGGILLLRAKEIKRLIKLVISAISSAVLSLFSYGVVWLATGAFELFKQLQTTDLSGIRADFLSSDVAISSMKGGILKLALTQPIKSIQTGIQFMLDALASGIDRSEFNKGFIEFLKELVFAFLPKGFNFSLIFWLLIIGFVVLLGLCVFLIVKNKISFSLTICGFGLTIILCCVVIQSVFPFTRVFSFLGIFFTLGIVGIIQLLNKHISKIYFTKTIKYAMFSFGTIILFIVLLLPNTGYFVSYNIAMGNNLTEDNAPNNAFEAIQNADLSDGEICYVNDAFLSQQIYFHFFDLSILDDKKIVWSNEEYAVWR